MNGLNSPHNLSKFSLPILKFSFHISGSITPSKELLHQTEVLPGRIQNRRCLLSFSFRWSVTAEKKSAFGHNSACCFDKPFGLKKARDLYLTADKGNLTQKLKPRR